MRMWDENIGWGGGSSIQVAGSSMMKLLDPDSDEYGVMRDIMDSFICMPQSHEFDLSEFIGLQGPQGPPGPRGLPGLPGMGTDYIPTTTVPSVPYTPAPTGDHFSEKPEVDHYWDVLIVWAELASGMVHRGGDITATGWAKVVNDTAFDNGITLWLRYYRHDEYHVGDPADWVDAGTAIGDDIHEDIPAGKTVTARITRSFTINDPNNAYYIVLFGRLDSYDTLYTPENHYGISGKEIYPR